MLTFLHLKKLACYIEGQEPEPHKNDAAPQQGLKL
jgi:hypothetical protein